MILEDVVIDEDIGDEQGLGKNQSFSGSKLVSYETKKKTKEGKEQFTEERNEGAHGGSLFRVEFSLHQRVLGGVADAEEKRGGGHEGG